MVSKFECRRPSDAPTSRLHELNRARLYFDVRLIPIAAADLQPLCKNLDDDEFVVHRTYKERIQSTHIFSVISETWDSERYSPMRERKSERADAARSWYPSVTGKPHRIGRRLAQCLSEMGIPSKHEQEVKTRHARVVAAVLCSPAREGGKKTIVELKAYAPEQTMPSSIGTQIRVTLKRHAQLAGFLARQ